MIKNTLNKDSFRLIKDLPTLGSNLTEFSSRLYTILDQIIEEVGVIKTGGFVSSSTVRTVKSDVVIPPVNPWTLPADLVTDGYLRHQDFGLFYYKYSGLPSQTGNSGKVLTTNGSVESWASVSSLTNDHATLTHLSYATSGHTGFEPTIGYVPLNISHLITYDHDNFLTLTHLSDYAHGDILHLNRADLDLVSGTNTGDQTLASLSPLTTKGDLFTFSTVNIRLPVGSNGYVLKADSTTATGLKWDTISSSSGTVTSFAIGTTPAGMTYNVANYTTTPVLDLGFDYLTLPSTGYIMFDSTIALRRLGTETWFCANAGNVTTTGQYSYGLGFFALHRITTGIENTCIGYESGQFLTDGNGNTGYGSQSLSTLTSGAYNIGVGIGANAGTTGSLNISLGQGLGSDLTSGLYNILIGQGIIQNSGSHSCTGNYNILIGKTLATDLTSGEYNFGVGYLALQNISSGSYNLALGSRALNACTTGSNNVALGPYAGKYATSSNEFYLDNQDRTNTAGDKAGALFYGVFNSTPKNQTLNINAVIFPIATTTANAPTYVLGGIYFDTTLNKLRVGGATGWETITSV